MNLSKEDRELSQVKEKMGFLAFLKLQSLV